MNAQQPPLLYAVGFLSSHPLFSHKNPPRAIRQHLTMFKRKERRPSLVSYGTVKAPNISRPFHVTDSGYLGLFLNHWHEDPSKRFGLTPYEIDDTLQRTIALETEQGTLHPQQRYLKETPYENLVWISNFAHHGGKTAPPNVTLGNPGGKTAPPKVTLGNPNHTPWTASEDAELRALAAETYEGKRLRGLARQPRGRYSVFAQHHGRTLAAVKMRAKRVGARSYCK